MLTISEVLLFLVEKGPGRTERELAEAIYGHGAYQQRVNQDCMLAANRGQVERRGLGGSTDPFRYYLARRQPDIVGYAAVTARALS
jgi:hypothetical protein